MTLIVRSYRYPEDYELVGQFLREIYTPGGIYSNWLQPRWEYMHFHPCLDRTTLPKIGIWEDAGKIVAVVNLEHSPGETFFQVHPDYTYLKAEMLDYAEMHLRGNSEKYPDKKMVALFINEFDEELKALASARGFSRNAKYPEYNTISQFVIPDAFPEITLPEGFTLKSLDVENDLRKINRVLWRGFNHPGEPPEEEIEGRKLMQSAPNFRKDLTIVVEAPDGNYVAFAGIWLEAAHKYAYIEPVATDPDYRRMGLGKAAVLESIRRCGQCGAEVAFVESAQPFYLGIGFETVFERYPWIKYYE